VIQSKSDFLLVYPLEFISHCFRDTATYWLKIVNFPYPLSFNAVDRADLIELPESLKNPDEESLTQMTVTIL